MTKIINLYHNQDDKNLESERFKNDILEGLFNTPKFIPAKYHYDEYGSHLFNQITHHPDYYLTNCELIAIEKNLNHLIKIFNNFSFNLIELGPGEGIKTNIIIESFLKASISFQYIPIDLSNLYLNKIVEKFNIYKNQFEILPIHGDYFDSLKWIKLNSNHKNLVLFLGSSIGNFNQEETQHFLTQLHTSLHTGDFLLIGFDLKKDEKEMLRAYQDSSGITKEFNLNVLRHINKVFQSNFNLKKFDYEPLYNSQNGVIESYLKSLDKQTIYFKTLKQSIHFEKHEMIHMENSFKYEKAQIQEIAKQNGFQIVTEFYDSNQYFVDSLWQII
ncbi:MAG TPA: L-histidine N(alpha)-methyltransferase [Legionellales bacterium]|nr:L-histidine N(alpha)-methyltransferase [Legionellales bacterium]